MNLIYRIADKKKKLIGLKKQRVGIIFRFTVLGNTKLWS